MPQLRQITLNLIYFLNILLLFLLVFEDRVQLPVFLQVTGRMHPLILHFPLALLFVGIFLEWLTTRKDFQHPVGEKITLYVFFLFALSASITALFGFFLYEEGAYQGDEMLWHKWMGTGVSLLSVLLIWLKKGGRSVYYTTLGLSAILVTLAGHLGAEITHGEGFLTEPIRRQWLAKPVHIDHPDSAIVFRDVIQPILNEKCVNCHNLNKAKNDLILTDYKHILKGGKNPLAVVPGKAAESLLYKYTLLPMQDTLHMPPDGKLQLDREEIRLIGWWINSGAHANEKYSNLPKPDSIHPIMLAKFQPRTGLDLLDIPFAAQGDISRLNNPYRTVQQISATKPYVAVFLGSKKDFNAKDLTELKAISDQVVSVDLGNSQVKNEDLKHLTDFPHLQKLHLQNIDIGDAGVKQLKGLQYLDVLNLSGTKVSSATLEEISHWKNLKKIYLYNTQISQTSLDGLKSSHPEIEVYNTHLDLSDSVYNAELRTPVCRIDSSFFRQSASVEIKLSRGRVKYYYTLDGSQPNDKANLYAGPLEVKQSAVLKVIATMAGWTDSKVATFHLLKTGFKPTRVIFETKPDPKFAAKPDTTLMDGKGGSLDRGDKQYLGFASRNVQIRFELDQPKPLSQVTLSFLEDVEKGVYPPEYIEVWGGEAKGSLKKFGALKAELTNDNRSGSKGLLILNFPKQPVRYVVLKTKRTEKLASWPPLQKNMKEYILMDEVSLQ